jgi:hypothetical protein
MAQSLSLTEGGNITPEDVEEWSEKLSHVLDTSPAWHKFRIYLELKQLNSEQALLGFRKKCNTFLLKTKKQPPHTRLEPKILGARSKIRTFLILVFTSMGPKFCISDVLLCFVNIVL